MAGGSWPSVVGKLGIDADSQWVSFMLLSHHPGNEVAGCWEFVQFPTPPFFTELDSGRGIMLVSYG